MIFSFMLISIIASSGIASLPAVQGIRVSDAGMDLVANFIGLFQNDYAIATPYDFDLDGSGSAPSTTIPGSPPFMPYKRAPLVVNGEMRITPVTSPTQSEDAIIALIESANSTLYIEQMYMYETLNDILLAIIAAKNAGVDVRVIQDDGTYDHNDISARILTKHGIPVRRMVENPSIGAPFDTMHNKGVIVDGKVVLISSTNWSPTSLRQNREAGVIIESTAVASYYQDLFLYDWGKSVTFTGSNYPDPAPVKSHYFSPTTYSGKFDVTCLAAPDNCFDAVSATLAGAQTSIWISTYTLSSPFIIEVLEDRLAAGVEVRLLLAENPVSPEEQQYNLWTMACLVYAGALTESGEIKYASGRWASATFEYQHCKYAIVDGKTLIISSGNYAQTSCPKPQPDGDVDGNRDWWFIVRGSSSGVSGETPGAGPVFIILFALCALIGVVARVRKQLVF
ncbi:MAG: phospholipase D-like domain-containing protein [Candidatus Sigynarchaeota archaeon]